MSEAKKPSAPKARTRAPAAPTAPATETPPVAAAAPPAPPPPVTDPDPAPVEKSEYETPSISEVTDPAERHKVLFDIGVKDFAEGVNRKNDFRGKPKDKDSYMSGWRHAEHIKNNPINGGDMSREDIANARADIQSAKAGFRA